MSVFGVSRKKLFVVIPAAGRSERMGGDIPKILMDVDGVPVIIRTLQAFQEFADSKSDITTHIIVVTSKELIFKINDLIEEYKISCVYKVIPGGDSRTESVGKGVDAIAAGPVKVAPADIVFVHDGARCLIDQNTLNNCLDGVLSYDICAAAVPLKSTVKIAVPLFTDEPEEEIPEVKEEKKPEPKPAPAAKEPEEEKPKKDIFEPVIPEAMREEDVFNETIPMIGISKDGSSSSSTKISSFSTKDAPINLFVEMEGRNVPSIGLSGLAAVPKPIDQATSPFKPLNPTPEPQEEPKPVEEPKRSPFGTKPAPVENNQDLDLDDIDNMDLSFNPFSNNNVAEPVVEKEPEPVAEPEPEVQEEPQQEEIKPAENTQTENKPMVYQVNATPSREALMEVQTPQAFKYEKIQKCYSYALKNHIEATDDLGLAELLDMKVYLVEGSYANIKITTPEDIVMAKALIK